MGKDRHVITYPVHGGKLFNIVCLHPETRPRSQWDEAKYFDELMEHFGDWDDT